MWFAFQTKKKKIINGTQFFHSDTKIKFSLDLQVAGYRYKKLKFALSQTSASLVLNQTSSLVVILGKEVEATEASSLLWCLHSDGIGPGIIHVQKRWAFSLTCAVRTDELTLPSGSISTFKLGRIPTQQGRENSVGN